MRRAPLAAAAATAVTVVVLLDVLRAWLPSVLLVYGRAGSTPATEMGLFALVPFLLAFGGVLAVRVVGARATAVAAAGVLAFSRIGVQATAGGDPQLWATTIGVLAGLILVGSLAAGAGGRHAPAGVVVGFGADAILLTLLRSTPLVWRGGLSGWLAAVALAAMLAAAVALASDHPVSARPRARTGNARSGRLPTAAWGWLVVGPALLLHGLLGGMPARLHTLTDWPDPAISAVVVGGHALAVVAAVWWRPGLSGRRAGMAGALILLAGLVAALSSAAPVVAAGHLLLPVGLGLAVAHTASTPGRARPSAAIAACAAGLLLFVATAFTYYAAYDILLPFPNRWVLVVAAVLVALLALSATATPEAAVEAAEAGGAPDRQLRLVPLPVVAGALSVLLVAAAAMTVTGGPPAAAAGEGPPVRLVLYNLQFGYDTVGAYAVDRQADVIAAEAPDIVVLNEVSRGWLVNGSIDVLPRLSSRTGLPYVFAPAADEVWGNAILSRYPLVEVEVVPLPRGDVPMRRSALAVVADLGDGTELGIVGTHLHHAGPGAEVRRAQVERLADLARHLHAAGRPVAVVGDLNAQPGDPELAPIEEWMDNALEAFGPIATYPSWEPDRHIDHIYATGGLVADDFSSTRTTASDHLPVAVTLQPAE